MSQVTPTPGQRLDVALYERDCDHFRKRRGWQKFRRKLAGAMAWLNTVQEFELYRGEAPFGRKKTMTGREARDANRDFEDQFARHCLAHPERRLWRWRSTNFAAAREVCKQAAVEKIK